MKKPIAAKSDLQKIKDVLSILPLQDRRKIGLVVVIQVFMGLMDLLGVALIGVLGALAVNGVKSSAPGNRVNQVIEFLHLENQVFQTQAAILGVTAAIVLIMRTLISVVFTRRTLYFLSRRGAMLTTSLVSKLLSQPLVKIQQNTSQDLVFALTTGVNSITLGILGAGVILISDLSLLVVMSIGLFAVDPVIALISSATFSGIAILIYRLMHSRAGKLGKEESRISISSNEAIIEVLASYRESVVKNRREFYAREIGKLRWKNASILAELSFMPNISKYIIESVVVLGALGISAAQFLMQDAAHAIATLAVFLAAGTRIAPAVMRVQQGALQIKSSLGIASPTIDLINSLQGSQDLEKVDDVVQTVHKNFEGKITIANVSLQYPGKDHLALENVSLEIPEGKSIALVGPSGAGKTSLVDVILGIIKPTSGSVSISGIEPARTLEKWPGAIGYVPQDVVLINGTIKENVSLGFPIADLSIELIESALELAQLSDFVKSQPLGINMQVGERGARISGGQRQRIGLARALFTKPKLLVLDEATSALDGETEASITESIQKLNGTVTVVMIAHRLSTIRNVDQVVYMDKGKIIHAGTFEEVRSAVSDFDNQAQLMGL